MHTEGILPITTTEIWSLKGKEAFMLLANVDTSETSIYMPIFQKMITAFIGLIKLLFSTYQQSRLVGDCPQRLSRPFQHHSQIG